MLDLKQPLSWAQLSGEEKELLADLQSNILAPHWHSHALCLFLQFSPPNDTEATNFCRSIANQVKPALKELDEIVRHKREDAAGTNTVCFYLTCSGYRALSFPEQQIPLHDAAFVAGLRRRGEVFPLNETNLVPWDGHLRGDEGPLHGMLFIAADDQAVLDEERRRLQSLLPPWVKIIGEEALRTRRHRVTDQVLEHFGFADGISKPLMVLLDSAAAQYVNWNPAFGIGLALTTAPLASTRVLGSFLVVLKLEQNVKAFDDQVKALAEALNDRGIRDEERAAALVIGRNRRGRPLIPVAGPGGASGPGNDFHYSFDPEGKQCPMHAHIRKVNPRGDRVLRKGGTLPQERAKQIVRRGMTYGPYDPGDPDMPRPESGSGLIFMAFQASIEDQFEYVFKNWVNQSDFAVAGTGRDPLVGHPPGEAQQWPMPGDQPSRSFALERCVTLKGGEYFFAPLISALRR